MKMFFLKNISKSDQVSSFQETFHPEHLPPLLLWWISHESRKYFQENARKIRQVRIVSWVNLCIPRELTLISIPPVWWSIYQTSIQMPNSAWWMDARTNKDAAWSANKISNKKVTKGKLITDCRSVSVRSSRLVITFYERKFGEESRVGINMRVAGRKKANRILINNSSKPFKMRVCMRGMCVQLWNHSCRRRRIRAYIEGGRTMNVDRTMVGWKIYLRKWTVVMKNHIFSASYFTASPGSTVSSLRIFIFSRPLAGPRVKQNTFGHFIRQTSMK